MGATAIGDLLGHSHGSIYSAVNRFQRRIELAANGTIGGGTVDEQHWCISSDGLVISGTSGICCTLKPDKLTHTVFHGPLNSDHHVSAILAPKSIPMGNIAVKNDLEIRVFGQKRSGHHAIMGWLTSQFRDGTYFFNDCIPFLDPFQNHINTSGFLSRYRGLIDHGLSGRSNDEVVSEVRAEEAVKIEQLRQLDKPRLMVSFEDFDIRCYEPHLVPPGAAGKSRRTVNVLILRDPFNHLASTMRFYGGEFTEECGEHIMCLWKQYAREVLGRTTYLPNKICISYNQWFSSREYRDQVASWFGVKNTDKGLNAVSPNGGGSSFDKSAYHGKAQAMPVLNRWTEFASDSRFLQLFADPELAGYANVLFGEHEGS